MATIKGMQGGLFAGKKPTPLHPNETTVSKSIRDFLDARHIYNDRLNAGRLQAVTRYFEKKTQTWKEFRKWVYLCKEGTPDRYFILSGRIYFIEVKAWGKKASDEQLQRHRELRRSGAVIIIADSIDSFIKQFEAIILDRQNNTNSQTGGRKDGKKRIESR